MKPRQTYGPRVRTLFFPAGNTIAMPAAALAEICRYSYALFPRLERITVYGSSQYIHRKGPDQLKTLAQAGLGRIHVGVESGDDVILTRIKKGATARDHIRAGQMARAAGIEINAYVILGIGGQDRSETHAQETARVISAMQPAVVRLRTFVPKVNTPLLADVQAGRFQMLSPQQVLRKPWSPFANHDAHAGYQRPLHQLPRHQWPAARGPGRHARGAAPGFGPGRIHLPPVLYRHAVIWTHQFFHTGMRPKRNVICRGAPVCAPS